MRRRKLPVRCLRRSRNYKCDNDVRRQQHLASSAITESSTAPAPTAYPPFFSGELVSQRFDKRSTILNSQSEFGFCDTTVIVSAGGAFTATTFSSFSNATSFAATSTIAS